ncbi:hypothetical protein [Pseudonocardia asaccharolytica]|uniref:Uncharacterized protein n=1 Tax=Pseudonocardia asaccharolytica DSM 44247 = NBRC 16224 TaxID=1123024 RepID=A0A511CXQ8_9PSEU|nr:hypothetical protein [Pseudonocardia asaccharolytica]GEL17322.1 hypothetical protein PA7_11590 [Pseudonocardia asaccharolytica DSM 44247 = NBRC 16224]
MPDSVERHRDTAGGYEEIRLALFSHGTDGVGVASRHPTLLRWS